MTPEVLASAFADTHAAVRAYAVRVSRDFAKVGQASRLSPPIDPRVSRDDAPAGRASGTQGTGGTPVLLPALLVLTNDPDAKVRGQLALALGDWPDARAGQALVHLALRDAGDPRLLTAVLSSATNHVGGMLAAIFSKDETAAGGSDLAARLIGLATVMNDRKAGSRFQS